jgi:S-DNA-T family DNA segregation ATPase FtsK/SpoIIIE
MVSIAGLESYYGIQLVIYPFVAGGLIGYSVTRLFSVFVDQLILGVLLHALLVISLILMTRLSFISWFKPVLFSINSCLDNYYVKAVIAFCRTVIMKFFVSTLSLIRHIKRLFDGSYFEKYCLVDELLEDDCLIEEQHDEYGEQKALSFITQESEVVVEKNDQPFSEPIEDAEVKRNVTSNKVKEVCYKLPPLSLLKASGMEKDSQQEDNLQQLALILEQKLARFGIIGSVVSIKKGPVITLFEYEPHIDAKLSKIVALEDDLALALQATSIRILAPIPGTKVVGFEVANQSRSAVHLATLLHAKEFQQFSGQLPFVLGVDTVGKTKVADLISLPHALVAGSTGSGKSVAMNVILMSLLYRCKPDFLKLILIDPKRLEFAPYSDIPHLLFPIVTDPKQASSVLQWVVQEMEKRYEQIASVGVRNILDFNALAAHKSLRPLPFIVIMIDELADLMMAAGKEIEEKIARLAQMARAAGIHLIIATQRPSVDVITGVIKANFPTRISFRIATKIDSRTILDTVGAEKLLGKGDMLLLDISGRLQRLHGAFVSDQEIEQCADHVRTMQKVDYLTLEHVLTESSDQLDDPLYLEVINFLDGVDEVSISLLQRRFRIGYNRSARIIDTLEAEGRILSSNGSKTRKVLR